MFAKENNMQTVGTREERGKAIVRETKFGYSEIKGTEKSVPQDEQYKIDCAIKHFKEIGGLDFRTVMSYDD